MRTSESDFGRTGLPLESIVPTHLPYGEHSILNYSRIVAVK